MSCGSKRKSEEWDVSEIQECTSAEVHFVVSELSPIKESRKNKKVKYFDSKVTDGKKVARAILFEPSLRAAFAESKDKGTPIKLLNCSVKPVTGQADKFEIFANNHSKVMKSPKKFVIGEECMSLDAQQIELSQIYDLSVDQVVNTVCKIVKVFPPEMIETKSHKQLTLQNITIGDAKACCKLAVWETLVGQLEEGKTYKIKDIKVKQYNHHKSLSTTTDTTIEEASDLGKVEELSDEEETSSYDIIEGEIDTVNVDEYQSCKRCKSKVTSVNNTIVECKKCNLMMKASKCDQSCTAKITVSGDEERVLTLFSNMVSDEIEGPSISLRLLAAPEHSFSVGDNNIVYAVKKL